MALPGPSDKKTSPGPSGKKNLAGIFPKFPKGLSNASAFNLIQCIAKLGEFVGEVPVKRVYDQCDPENTWGDGGALCQDFANAAWGRLFCRVSTVRHEVTAGEIKLRFTDTTEYDNECVGLVCWVQHVGINKINQLGEEVGMNHWVVWCEQGNNVIIIDPTYKQFTEDVTPGTFIGIKASWLQATKNGAKDKKKNENSNCLTPIWLHADKCGTDSTLFRYCYDDPKAEPQNQKKLMWSWLLSGRHDGCNCRTLQQKAR